VKFRVINIVALALGLACILTLILSANSFVNGSIFKIPLVSMIGDSLGQDMDEIDEEYSDMLDIVDDALDDEDNWRDFEREFGISVEDLEDEMDMTLEEFRDLFDPLSISHLAKIGEITVGEDDEAVMALNMVVSLINGYATFLVILMIFAVIFHKTWITVLTYIFSIGFLALTGGLVAFVLGSIFFIATAVLYSKMKMEYKFYLRSFGM